MLEAIETLFNSTSTSVFPFKILYLLSFYIDQNMHQSVTHIMCQLIWNCIIEELHNHNENLEQATISVNPCIKFVGTYQLLTPEETSFLAENTSKYLIIRLHKHSEWLKLGEKYELSEFWFKIY